MGKNLVYEWINTSQSGFITAYYAGLTGQQPRLQRLNSNQAMGGLVCIGYRAQNPFQEHKAETWRLVRKLLDYPKSAMMRAFPSILLVLFQGRDCL